MRHNDDILMLLAVAHKILINNRNDAQVQPDDLQCQFGQIHLGWATFRAMPLKVAGERTAVLPNIAEIQGVAVRCCGKELTELFHRNSGGLMDSQRCLTVIREFAPQLAD